MRQLSLHASALNDAEYELYTSCLRDLAWTDETDGEGSSPTSGHDDAYFERIRIGVRELRGWMRGRYAHVAPASLDGILRFFSPNMGPMDTISGGQFFAALRLVVHVESGSDLDRGLAFIQAHPSYMSPSMRQLSPERLPENSFSALPAHHFPASTFDQQESPVQSLPATNPFTPPYSNTDTHSHPSQRTKSPLSHSIHNPFFNRTVNDEKSSPAYGAEQTSVPPQLPPRKPSLIPPPVHPALVPSPRHKAILLPQGPKSVSPTRNTTALAHPRTPSPLPPPQTHSSVIKKGTQTAKKREQENKPVFQVLKSSAVISGGYSLTHARVAGSSVVVGTSVHNRTRSRSASPSKVFHGAPSEGSSLEEERGRAQRAPPLPRRQRLQQPSPPGSVGCHEQVPSASSTNAPQTPTTPAFPPQLPPPSPSYPHPSASPHHAHRPLPVPGIHNGTNSVVYSSPRASPTRSFTDLPTERPPTHLDRNFNPKMKPPHVPYLGPPSPSGYTTTSITRADAIPDYFASTSTHPSSLPPTPTKPKPSFPFYNLPAPTNSNPPFANAQRPIAPTKSPPPVTNAPITPRSQSESSSTARVFRSKSPQHHPSPPLPPLPAHARATGVVRRKRPESVLVLSSGEIVFGGQMEDGGKQDPNMNGYRNSNATSPTKYEYQDQGAEGRRPSALSRHTSHSSLSPGGHRRSASVSSSSTNQTSVSQPAPQSHSHERY